jgi:predicted lactoylglutathione lyase
MATNVLSCDSHEQVDEMVRKAVAAGGSTYSERATRPWLHVWTATSGRQLIYNVCRSG